MVSETVSWSAHQSRSRVLVKTVCYRFLMVVVTIFVAWVIVGDLGSAASIGLVANVVKTGTYMAYERVWDHIRWGVSAAS